MARDDRDRVARRRRGGVSGRLLIAGEGWDVRAVLRALFSREFPAIDEAANGPDAVRLLGSYSYAAMVLDLSDAAGRGAVLDHLHAQLPALLASLVILRDGRDHEFAESASRAGVGAVVEKPFEAADLLDTVRALSSSADDPNSVPVQ